MIPTIFVSVEWQQEQQPPLALCLRFVNIFANFFNLHLASSCGGGCGVAGGDCGMQHYQKRTYNDRCKEQLKKKNNKISAWVATIIHCMCTQTKPVCS